MGALAMLKRPLRGLPRLDKTLSGCVSSKETRPQRDALDQTLNTMFRLCGQPPKRPAILALAHPHVAHRMAIMALELRLVEHIANLVAHPDVGQSNAGRALCSRKTRIPPFELCPTRFLQDQLVRLWAQHQPWPTLRGRRGFAGFGRRVRFYFNRALRLSGCAAASTPPNGS